MSKLRDLEALLFVVGEEGIGLEELSYLLEIDTADVYQSLDELKQLYYENKNSALNILETGNHFILTTKKEMSPLLKRYAQSPASNKLSQAALETLSIIAYKQPITRVQIDEIRGVQSSGAVQKLVANQLIAEKGRVEGPGRAILYGTTEFFMDYFALKSLEELPPIDGMEEQLEAEMPFDLFFERYNKSDLAYEEDAVKDEQATTDVAEEINSATANGTEITENAADEDATEKATDKANTSDIANSNQTVASEKDPLESDLLEETSEEE